MDDFISRAAAIETAIDAVDDWDGGYNPNREEVIRKHFESMPTVDAVPVVHGLWIEVDEGDGDYTYDCSVCGGKWWLAADTPEANGMKYCPYCGAKMDGERRESE